MDAHKTVKFRRDTCAKIFILKNIVFAIAKITPYNFLQSKT